MPPLLGKVSGAGNTMVIKECILSLELINLTGSSTSRLYKYKPQPDLVLGERIVITKVIHEEEVVTKLTHEG